MTCICVAMHLWMHIGAQIILTQLGSTSPWQPMRARVRGHQLRPLCWSAKPLSHLACIISPRSYGKHQTHARSYNPIFPLTFVRIITLSHKHSFSDMRYYDCVSLLFWAACYDVPHRILGDYGGGTLDPQGSVQGFVQKKYILKR